MNAAMAVPRRCHGAAESRQTRSSVVHLLAVGEKYKNSVGNEGCRRTLPRGWYCCCWSDRKLSFFHSLTRSGKESIIKGSIGGKGGGASWTGTPRPPRLGIISQTGQSSASASETRADGVQTEQPHVFFAPTPSHSEKCHAPGDARRSPVSYVRTCRARRGTP